MKIPVIFDYVALTNEGLSWYYSLLVAGENLRLKTSHKNRGLCNFSRIYSILHPANTLGITKAEHIVCCQKQRFGGNNSNHETIPVTRTKLNSKNSNGKKKRKAKWGSCLYQTVTVGTHTSSTWTFYQNTFLCQCISLLRGGLGVFICIWKQPGQWEADPITQRGLGALSVEMVLLSFVEVLPDVGTLFHSVGSVKSASVTREIFSYLHQGSQTTSSILQASGLP